MDVGEQISPYEMKKKKDVEGLRSANAHTHKLGTTMSNNISFPTVGNKSNKSSILFVQSVRQKSHV